MRRRPVELPSLVHDFSHAHIQTVSIGPRREVTMAVSPLVWEGCNARNADPVSVRFGGIENFVEVSAFFAAGPHEQSELAWLRYAESQHSKPGFLFFELAFERIDVRLVVQCSSLQVGKSVKRGLSDPGARADGDIGD